MKRKKVARNPNANIFLRCFGVNKKSTKNILKCQKKCYNNMFLPAINCLGVRGTLQASQWRDGLEDCER